MSWQWTLYAARPSRDLFAIENELARLLIEWVDERGEEGAEELAMTCGEIASGGTVPKVDYVAHANANFGKQVDAAVLERLATCECALSIDRVRDSGLEHPLQVSILRYLITQLGSCVVDWGEHRLALSEAVLEELKRHRSRGELGDSSRPVRKPVRTRKERPGEVRAIRILETRARCLRDPDLAIDLKRLPLRSIQLKYIALLESNGAISDRDAAVSLAINASELEGELSELDALLRALLE